MDTNTVPICPGRLALRVGRAAARRRRDGTRDADPRRWTRPGSRSISVCS